MDAPVTQESGVSQPVPPEHANRSRRILRNVTFVGFGLVGLFISQKICIPTAVVTGIWVPECPSGDLRQTVQLEYENLQREKYGTVKLRVNAHYTVDSAADVLDTFVRLYRTDLSLVYTAEDKELPLEVDRWNLYAGVQAGNVRLPRVPDGDYLLRAKVRSAVADQVIDVPLPLYAPARVHILTDRPLYEPGNTVLFRAVALRASDMRPLPGRPGTWKVLDQYGTVLMEEKVSTDEWGVAVGSFPLDRLAESGQWTVTFTSGDDTQSRPFTVEPFTLPRFTVEATPSAPFFVPGDAPEVSGQVTYSSGAPVSDAEIEISWQVLGSWPAPTAWQEGALPKVAQTDESGNFTLELPFVPADLQGQATLLGRISAIDPAGDRVSSAVSLLLSEDRIQAEAITELGDGLVDGFNNRVFLRVTTASGAPLVDTDVVVKRAWDPTDPGKEARTDADGVASLQLDPGPPVNVVIPPPPVRPPPRKKPVRLTGARDLLAEREATLGERLEMDGWIAALEPCANHIASGATTLSLGVSVDASGRIAEVTHGTAAVEACAAEVVRGRRLPAGQQRLMQLDYRISDPELPTLYTSVSAPRSQPSSLSGVLEQAALAARSCLPEDVADTQLPHALLWSVSEDSDQLSLHWDRQTRSTRLAAADVACVEQAVLRSARTLPSKAGIDAIGLARFGVREASRLTQRRAEPTVMLGYELAVSAARGDEDLGDTLLRIQPSRLPPLRIRANPVIAAAGEAVTFEFIRGPDFAAELPEEVTLAAQLGEDLEAPFDREARTATFTLPAEAEGWYTLQYGGAAARVFVPDADQLDLALSTDREVYRPGESVTLNVQTSAPASVGLFGVDQSLAQLTPLPGVDDMADALIVPPSAQDAFPGIDSQALVMGRIRGENAAQAMVMRINSVPTVPERDRPASGINTLYFDPIEDLTDSFYTVLAELHVQVRDWERAAPEGEQMTNETMARLWEDAVAACAARGEPATDAYGRRLRLSWLPYDLLAMTAPHEVVLDGTRLPEDVINWIDWIEEEYR